MKKAVNLSNSFASFLKLCRVYCDKKMEMPKLNLDENEIFAKLSIIKANIHEALCDDFNTCLVIDELFELTNLMNKEFQSVLDPNLSTRTVQSDDLNRHYGCVMSVCNFIEYTLDLFGIQSDLNSQKSVILNKSIAALKSSFESFSI